MNDLPPFYDDLTDCLAELWRRLAQGAGDRRSAFHTPSFATIGADGGPRVRVVVLRSVDAEGHILRIHCDRRSDKAAEIAARGTASLLVYDAGAKIQIRVEGTARVHAEDALADAAWAEAQAMSRVCYGITPGPGTALPDGNAYTLPGPDETALVGRENFSIILIRAERLDFLYLDRRGHRRAAWRRDGEGWAGSWVVP